ncbi:uncharacterized protein LOC133721232 [Rosa rugosa]|uniref:uncharacterized protein LOC133721232 n=1 Tax=Rosa rugosa TaxID=74645 RepID=UPI002B40E2E3|nr:uncharacterized protein LOC133721232 [Rosa rugosa]
MEGRKPAGSSSSSSTSELLGSKDSSSSSSGIFGAIFAPPLNSPKVLSRESLRSELTRKKITDQPLNFHSAEPGTYYSGKEGEGQSTRKEDMSSYYEDQRVQSPCHLSSSIYYGGQDIYNYPQNSQSTGINSTFKKDGTDDDGTACRGNWWQGSLYY